MDSQSNITIRKQQSYETVESAGRHMEQYWVPHSTQQKNLRYKGKRKKKIKINKKTLDKRGCNEDKV